MNALRHFSIKDGSALLAGDDHADNLAYLELVRASLWQAASHLGDVEDCSSCSFREEIDVVEKIFNSIMEKYAVAMNSPEATEITPNC